MRILVTARACLPLAREHGLAIGSMTGFTRKFVVHTAKSERSEIVHLFQIGLPTVYGMTAIAPSPFSGFVNVDVTTVTIYGQSLVLIIYMAFHTIQLRMFAPEGVIRLPIVIEFEQAGPSLG
jgi:hypothetical protein